MNANVIFGGIAAVVLGGIVLHGCERKEAPKPVPVVTKVAPIPVPAPKPVSHVAKRPTPKAKPKATPRMSYHRVLPGGKQGPEVSCGFVRSFVAGKTPAQLAELAKQYHVSESQLASYSACLK